MILIPFLWSAGSLVVFRPTNISITKLYIYFYFSVTFFKKEPVSHYHTFRYTGNRAWWPQRFSFKTEPTASFRIAVHWSTLNCVLLYIETSLK